MNRALYIVGIVFSVIFSGVISYYADEVDNARWNSYYDSFSSYSDYSYDYSYMFNSDDEDLTVEAGLWSIFFILSFITIDLLGLLKVKTKTTKVLSIIGLSFSAIWLIWSFGMLSSPGSMSFDEVQPAWAFYATLMLAFTIVGLVQAVRYHKRKSQVVAKPTHQDTSVTETKDLLDS